MTCPRSPGNFVAPLSARGPCAAGNQFWPLLRWELGNFHSCSRVESGGWVGGVLGSCDFQSKSERVIKSAPGAPWEGMSNRPPLPAWTGWGLQGRWKTDLETLSPNLWPYWMQAGDTHLQKPLCGAARNSWEGGGQAWGS